MEVKSLGNPGKLLCGSVWDLLFPMQIHGTAVGDVTEKCLENNKRRQILGLVNLWDILIVLIGSMLSQMSNTGTAVGAGGNNASELPTVVRYMGYCSIPGSIYAVICSFLY